MKIQAKLTILFFVATITQNSLRGQDRPVSIPAEEIKDDASLQSIFRNYAIMRADDKNSEEVKAGLAMQFLVIANNYLKIHVRPEGKVESNIRPPDGSLSGVSPESIKDPEMRAKYTKMLEENRKMSEGQNIYDSAFTFRKDILSFCLRFINEKPANAKIISDALAKYSKDAEQFTELKRMIVDKAIEQNVSRPEWPESPLK